LTLKKKNNVPTSDFGGNTSNRDQTLEHDIISVAPERDARLRVVPQPGLTPGLRLAPYNDY
jgi:hypothetical protein